MQEGYLIIEWFVKIHNLPNVSFRRTEIEDKSILFEVEVLSDNKEEIHGLECFLISDACTHITRRGGDVMLADKTWEHAVILPLQERTHADSFLCQLFYTHAVQRHIIISSISTVP